MTGQLPGGQGSGLEGVGHDRSARHGGPAGPTGGHGRGSVVDGQVDVDAPMHPQGMDAEVGDEVDGRNAEASGGPQPAEAEGGQRIGGHDHVRARLRTHRNTRRRVRAVTSQATTGQSHGARYHNR